MGHVMTVTIACHQLPPVTLRMRYLRCGSWWSTIGRYFPHHNSRRISSCSRSCRRRSTTGSHVTKLHHPSLLLHVQFPLPKNKSRSFTSTTTVTHPDLHHCEATQVSAPITATERRKQLIACRIYLNAGGDESHVPVLHDLMVLAQTAWNTAAVLLPIDDHDRNDFTKRGALIRVEMDPCSNRSSFHLAGPVHDVITITHQLVDTALHALAPLKRGCKLPVDAKNMRAVFKVVNIVEHISFLPLLPGPESNITDNKNKYPPLWVPTYTGHAARQLGTLMRERNHDKQQNDDTTGSNNNNNNENSIQVLFYGHAQRSNLSYEAIVARRTNNYGKLQNHKVIPAWTLIGTFSDYVEDVHVLLAAQAGKQRIRELTKLLNSPDTGLTDVVATAQLYDVFRWDIHCRLLRPHLSGSNMAAIEHVMKQWNELQKSQNEMVPIEFVIKCFRVGPTYEECINALQKVSRSEPERHEYDDQVRNAFESCADYYRTQPTTGTAST